MSENDSGDMPALAQEIAEAEEATKKLDEAAVPIPVPRPQTVVRTPLLPQLSNAPPPSVLAPRVVRPPSPLGAKVFVAPEPTPAKVPAVLPSSVPPPMPTPTVHVPAIAPAVAASSTADDPAPTNTFLALDESETATKIRKCIAIMVICNGLQIGDSKLIDALMRGFPGEPSMEKVWRNPMVWWDRLLVETVCMKLDEMCKTFFLKVKVKGVMLTQTIHKRVAELRQLSNADVGRLVDSLSTVSKNGVAFQEGNKEMFPDGIKTATETLVMTPVNYEYFDRLDGVLRTGVNGHVVKHQAVENRRMLWGIFGEMRMSLSERDKLLAFSTPDQWAIVAAIGIVSHIKAQSEAPPNQN